MIRAIASGNQCGELRSLNQMKGGFTDESPFYHSFGSFINYDSKPFDGPVSDDFPMNMEYNDVESLSKLMP